MNCARGAVGHPHACGWLADTSTFSFAQLAGRSVLPGTSLAPTQLVELGLVGGPALLRVTLLCFDCLLILSLGRCVRGWAVNRQQATNLWE